MNKKLTELIEEFRSVVSGKTADALFPPLVFAAANSVFGLEPATAIALAAGLLFGLLRILKKQSLLYALGGLAGVAVASGLALLTRSASSFFIPALAGSSLLLAASALSIALDRPLAAWASHLTRGWPLEWFWRKDVKPAYREVTLLWSFFFLLRLLIQVSLFRAEDVTSLAWSGVLLGWPALIALLTVTYVYGIWRLRRLKGPGVDEFRQGKNPPWRGQTRGF